MIETICLEMKESMHLVSKVFTDFKLDGYISSLFSVLLLPVLVGLCAVWVGVHGGSSWLPVSWADLSILIGVLEGGDKSDELVGASSDWKVADGGVSKDTLVINNVGGSESDTGIWAILDEAAVILGNLVGLISEHWDLHLTEATLLPVLLGPLLVAEVGVGGAGNDLAVELVELGLLVRELDDLSWAHESEIEWVEEKDDVFTLELLEADLLEFLVPPSLTLECWCWLSHTSDLSLALHFFCSLK